MATTDYCEITGNSWISLGDAFRGDSLRVSETNLGENVYDFLMERPFMGMKGCYVYTTPLTCRVSEIVFYRDVPEATVRSEMFGAMVKYMSRYGNVDVQTSNRRSCDLRCRNGVREVVFESKKSFGSNVRFSLRYIDNTMKELAEGEEESLFMAV